MMTLTGDECRVLGVLVEKALTTPDQYPLTVNAVVSGSNQKSNRDPVLSLDEATAFEALEGLRKKGLAVRVDSVGSRTNRYRHNAGEVLRLKTGELAVLAELLLRGPQTLGELRGRASRMHPLDTLDVAADMLRGLAERPEPLVRDVPPSPGSRAGRYAQLLCPEAHEVGDAPQGGVIVDEPRSSAVSGGTLSTRVERLEADVQALRDALRRLAAAVGEPNPLQDPPAGPAADAPS